MIISENITMIARTLNLKDCFKRYCQLTGHFLNFQTLYQIHIAKLKTDTVENRSSQNF